MASSRERSIDRALADRLEDLVRAGVQQLPKPPEIKRVTPPSPPISTARPPIATQSSPIATQSPPPSPPIVASPPPIATEVRPTAPEPPTRSLSTPLVASQKAPAMPSAPQLSRPQRENQLFVLSQEVARCVRCEELSSQRTQTVFGVGNPEARLCFLGEGPGADEDAQGEPFVGRAGQLLNKIITACTLRREDVYILNVVKCRPPGNRNPKPDEVVNCRPFFERQLEVIRPEFICCLGSVAASALLESTDTIGRLRGRFHTWRFAKVIATYHPAYLLRNPPAKAEVWKDMQMLMAEMGIELPKTQ